MNRRVTPAAVPLEKKEGRADFVFRMPPIFRSDARTVSTPPQSQKRAETYRGVSIFHLLFICLCLAVAACGMLYHLHVRFEGVRLGYEASEQRKIQTRLMLKRRELRLELASMKEPGRIEDEAREKLGMETPNAEEFVQVNSTRKVVSVSGGAL